MIPTIAMTAGIRRVVLLLVLALAVASGFTGIMTTPRVAAQASPAAGAAAANDEIAITGLVTSPGVMTLDDLQAMPSRTVEVSYTSGGAPELHTFTGVPLVDVLNTVGLPGEVADHESRLRLYIVLMARDGYQVVLTYGEIDPYLGNAPVLLAWDQDGEPIPAEHGPVQLVVPGDLFESRYIWAITGIEVRSIDAN